MLVCCFMPLKGIATVFQLYCDSDMIYENEKARAHTFTDSRDPPTPYRHVTEELAFDEAVSYTQWVNRSSTAKFYSSDRDSYPCPQDHIPRALTN